jgi:hypothetical protein
VGFGIQYGPAFIDAYPNGWSESWVGHEPNEIAHGQIPSDSEALTSTTSQPQAKIVATILADGSTFSLTSPGNLYE